MRPAYEVADVFRLGAEEYRSKHGVSTRQLKIMQDIEDCRTPIAIGALGGHLDSCDACGYLRISYNSCRNSHCPKCQSMAREAWLEKRRNELLPVKYFHLVFTLPSELHDIIRYNERLCYGQLFTLAWESLSTLTKDRKYLGAKTGMIAVLHIPTCGTGQAVGPKPALSSSYSLSGARRWVDQKREVEKGS